MKTSLFIAIALLTALIKVNAQTDSNAVPNSPQGGSEKFLFAGEAFTLWQSNHLAAYNGAPDVKTNSFGADPLGIMLMPLVKLGDRLFLDAQIEVGANPAPGG